MSKRFGSLDFAGSTPLMFGMTPDEVRVHAAHLPTELLERLEETITRLEFAATLVHGLDLEGDADD